MNYIHNDIVKPFKFKILCYVERVREIHDLDKYLHPPSMKGESAEADNWNICNQEFTVDKIWIEIKDRLHSSM